MVGFNAVLTSEHFGAFLTFGVLHAALLIQYIKVWRGVCPAAIAARARLDVFKLGSCLAVMLGSGVAVCTLRTPESMSSCAAKVTSAGKIVQSQMHIGTC